MNAALPALYALTPIESFPEHLARILIAVIGADKCDYTRVDRASGDFTVLVWPEPQVLRGLADARRIVMAAHPALTHFLRSDAAGARLISDFLTTVEYRRLPLYGEFFRPVGVEDQLTVPVTSLRDVRVDAISLDRDARSFTEDDRRTLDLFHPHLVQAHANAVRFSTAIRGHAAPAAARLARLSDREHDVLAHLAGGLTNPEIGLRLHISAGTVRKHVEHILQRLEVPNRTAAAGLYVQAAPPRDPVWTAQLARFVPRPVPS